MALRPSLCRPGRAEISGAWGRTGAAPIVASRLGAEVCATDEMEALLEHTVANADANACTVVSRQLDFTRQAEVLSIGDEAWDVVLFADVIYSGDGGEALPHALAELLLRGRPGAIAVGGFPQDIRAGIDAFWAQTAAIGLEWEEVKSIRDDDPRCGRLYVFRATAHTRPRDRWGDADTDPLVDVAPLFDEEECGEGAVQQDESRSQGGAKTAKPQRAQETEEELRQQG